MRLPSFVWAASILAAGVQGNVQPAFDLITRNFGHDAASAFELALQDGPCGEDGATPAPCFAVSQSEGKVKLTATSMSELTYGIGRYTRFVCNLTVGWPRGGGSSNATGLSWPCTASMMPMAMGRAVPYTYMDNVCTHSYSYVWYDEEDWVRHIDWMALAGINVFLAMTGQEEVQYKAFRQFGLEDQDIREFFNGPAYLTWSRGQSMQSVGASAMPEDGMSGLPRSWMQGQWLLQKQILKLTRALGIIGVLPAFQGNMPPQIKKMYPQANISTTHADRPGGDNITKGDCAWVASTDPLFGLVADAWMQTLIADFGTDHWYQCDGFFTGAKPPWLYETVVSVQDAMASDATAVGPIQPDPNWAPVWTAAWKGMARTDPQAKWLYQGWAIRGWDDAAGASRIRALYEAVPHGQWIPLDMDVAGIWRYFGNYSFFGAPFIWTTLHNMGGNDGLKGDMRLLQHMPSDAVASGASIIGTGSTPEGIDQNPAYYEYTFDTAWKEQQQSLDSWFAAYSARRYGVANEDADAAWRILSTAVYNSEAGGWHDDTGVEWGLGDAPAATGFATAEVFKAWQLLAQAGATIDPRTCSPLNYDIVNVGREVLAQLITAFELNLTAAVAGADKARAMSIAATLLQAYADLDGFLECDNAFLLGPWIAQARRFANATDAPASYYEWQARSQISTWWPVAPAAREDPATFKKFPNLDNYANKHWNGLVRDFYAKRVECYVNQVTLELTSANSLNTTNITHCAVTAELDFTQDTTTKYAEVAASGQTLSMSFSLMSRYGKYVQ